MASELSASIREASDDLRQLGVEFALVGGLAVSARGAVRFTRDVDLALAMDDDSQVEALMRDLKARGYAIIAIIEQEDSGRIATVRTRTRAGVVVDLITASSGIEREIVQRATSVEVPGVGPIPVARAEELVAMKVLSANERRLQDHLDFRSLLAVSDVDLETVRASLEAIRSRGFARGEALQDKLAAMLDASRA